MADFVRFGQDMSMMAGKCAGNMDRHDAALFLMWQQELIQADTIKARLDGKANAKKNGGSQSATSMLEQMRAMMKG